MTDTAPTRTSTKLPPALAKAIAKARSLEHDASKTELEKRYTIAALAKDVRDDASKYGDKGLEKLARAIGRDRSTVFRAAEIATCWQWRELKSLSAREGANGVGVTWSHLELVAPQSTPKKREQLLERILAEGLSVRALKRAVQPRRTKPELAEGPDKDANDLNEVTAKVFAIVSLLGSRLGRFHEPQDDRATPVAAARRELRRELELLRTTVDDAIGALATEPTAASNSDGKQGLGAVEKSGRPDNPAPPTRRSRRAP